MLFEKINLLMHRGYFPEMINGENWFLGKKLKNWKYITLLRFLNNN